MKWRTDTPRHSAGHHIVGVWLKGKQVDVMSVVWALGPDGFAWSHYGGYEAKDPDLWISQSDFARAAKGILKGRKEFEDEKA